MSEDSEEEDYSDRSISDDDDLDEDSFMKFLILLVTHSSLGLHKFYWSIS
uniref:ATP/GTP binding protein-like 3 n=1 Tax=Mus musculus TaxID=10090 RepID=D3Z4P1_MOUSE